MFNFKILLETELKQTSTIFGHKFDSFLQTKISDIEKCTFKSIQIYDY